MHKTISKLGVLLFVLGLVASVSVLRAEEVIVSETTPVVPETEAQPMYVFGEVVSVNSDLNEITIQYYDYELNELKEMILAADNNTIFENFQAISEISSGDTVNVEYNAAEGRNAIQKISVERIEAEESSDEPLDAEIQGMETQPETN